MREITPDHFQAEVLESEQPIIAYFSAAWCGPCRVLGPQLEAYEAQSGSPAVVKVDADTAQQLCATYGVMSLPTMILFKHGQVAFQARGAMKARHIAKAFAPHL